MLCLKVQIEITVSGLMMLKVNTHYQPSIIHDILIKYFAIFLDFHIKNSSLVLDNEISIIETFYKTQNKGKLRNDSDYMIKGNTTKSPQNYHKYNTT